MRILVHDYSGHPFQVQLSRALARRGHTVLHLHAAFFQTPKGRLTQEPGDAQDLAIEGIGLGEPFAKYNFVKRRAQEVYYGALLAGRAAAFAPDLVLCANTPLDPLAQLQSWCSARRIPFVFWVQDIYSVAIDRILRRKLGPLGALIGKHYIGLEGRVARASSALVLITDDFSATLDGWGVDRERRFVIENWAPLDEIAPLPRDNAWARQQGLTGKIVLLYAGTLGLKHNPALLTALAEHFRDDGRVAVVVASEGPGADWLRAAAIERGLSGLRVLPFQPYERFAEMLASADIALAILEPDAGAFAVPSKVLSHFCAGRPTLAAIPSANLAARLIRREEAGLVADPSDAAGFVAAAEKLVASPQMRETMGKNALDYARETFDIDAIVARFERVFAKASAG